MTSASYETDFYLETCPFTLEHITGDYWPD